MATKTIKPKKIFAVAVLCLSFGIATKSQISLKASQTDDTAEVISEEVVDDGQTTSSSQLEEPEVLESKDSEEELNDTEETTKIEETVEESFSRGLAGLRATGSVLGMTNRVTALENEGWEETAINTPAYLTLPNNDQLRYYFGGKLDIGETEDGKVQGQGEVLANTSRRVKIPNVDYIDNSDDVEKTEVIPHLFIASNNVVTSQGLIVATETNGVLESSIMYNEAGDFRLFEKEVNGHISKKLLYIAGYHDKLYNPELLVETTMTALPIGRIKIDQKVTNTAVFTYDNFMLGYSEDTKLGKDDDVPVLALGGRRGFYIQNKDNNKKIYRLSYFVTEKDYPGLNGPDNWRGYHWTRYNDFLPPEEGQLSNYSALKTFFSKHTSTQFPNAWGAFRQINSLGDEATNWSPNDVIFSGYDSAVSYKNQPISLGSLESTGFSWVIGLEVEIGGPEVYIPEKTLIAEQESHVLIEGNWRDINSQKVSLYYKLKDGQERLIAKDVPNDDLNVWRDFNFTIDASLLEIGDNPVDVYAINDDNKTSPVEKVIVKVKSKATIVYQDRSGNPLSIPSSMNPPTEFSGLVGETYNFPVPDLTPEYEFIEVQGGTVANDSITGTFGSDNTTIKMIYQEIAKEVKMTVNYRLKGTDLPLKKITDNNNPVPSETRDVTIGLPISSYIDEYKIPIEGYTFDSVQGDTGNVPNTDFAVTIYYEGQLSLEKVPTRIEFGSHKLISFGSKILKPTTNVSVEILDTQENDMVWDLRLKVKEELQTIGNEPFIGDIKFKTPSTDMLLNNISQPVFLKEGNKIGYDTITWNRDTEGLYLVQRAGNLKETYTGTLEWTLTDGL